MILFCEFSNFTSIRINLNNNLFSYRMLAVWKTTLLLLLLTYLTTAQLQTITGNNNADFATDVIYMDMSLVYGNSSAPSPGPNFTKVFPSDFVSPGIPMLMISLEKLEHYESSSDPIMYLYLNRPSNTSTSFLVSYGSSKPYYIKTMNYYYLVISSKYNSSPYFNIINEVGCHPSQNLTLSSTFDCSANLSSTFNSTGSSVVAMASILGLANTLNSNYLFGYTLQFTGISGTQAKFILKGAFTDPTFIYWISYDCLVFNTAITYKSISFLY